MINKYRSLNKFYKISIWTALVTFVLSLAFIPFYFFDYQDVPLGLLLGGFLGAIVYFVQGLGEKREAQKQNNVFSMIIIIIRYFLFLGVLIGIAILYYVANQHIFNLFSYIAGYTLSTIILIIFMVKEKD